jgi:hypothetical protein
MSQQLHRRREWKLTRSLVIPSCRRSRVKAGEVRQDRAASDELAIISPPPPLRSMIGGLLFSTRPRGHAAVQQQWYQQFESRSLRQHMLCEQSLRLQIGPEKPRNSAESMA